MVTLHDISIGYGSRILASGLSAEFPVGTLTAITGRNGTGKSTLLRVIAGLERPLAGKCEIRDTRYEAAMQNLIENSQFSIPSPRELAKIVGFVSTERPRVTNLRVGDLVALGRSSHTGWMGRLNATDRVAVADALALVGMGQMADKQLDTLSDGEAQRAMIARVLAQDTPVVLLDEPTAFLDFAARREIVELLVQLVHKDGKTVIFSSHELELVRATVDKTITLGDD